MYRQPVGQILSHAIAREAREPQPFYVAVAVPTVVATSGSGSVAVFFSYFVWTLDYFSGFLLFSPPADEVPTLTDML